MESLQERFAADAFVRDVVVGVIAEVAFKGRIPRRRPPGASWDRGLIWWAATIAGTTPQEFDAGVVEGVQAPLFAVEEAPPRAGRSPGRPRRRSDERAVAAALRDLLSTAQDDQVPGAAIRGLLRQLEGSHSAEPPERE